MNKKLESQKIKVNNGQELIAKAKEYKNSVEIIDGQDGNMYLYVGEKNDSGGREIKVGITRAEFEKVSRDEDDTPQKALEDF
ncbi:39218_t:CDS:2 [Gigaspora margarita]|uniref:39218_t:CDS:1 n=1 Tax=Gigaspora margarita TaxID=4874 RepID=A0ABN7UA54_GIGMA|nr:39218_t:CDS:2 [Gigaspora margarita]